MDDITDSPGTGGALPSGRFVLRINPELHAALRWSAAREGVSLNEFCVRRLTGPVVEGPGPAAAIVARALRLFGDTVVGIVVFGSWARDEMADGSDLDVLIVLEARVRITRALYREWDAAPLTWGHHPVEVHFATQPAEGARVSGIWAEVSIDGAVLFDPQLELSRWLAEVRRRILAGEIVRMWAHGQPYWAEVA